jgi:16S rRNA G966 N2-methylase RsmD
LWKALLSDEIQAFIHQNEGTDAAELALKSPLKSDPSFLLALEQVAARKKAKYKLPSWFKFPKVLFPIPLSLEQCSSELAATFKAEIVSGSKLVDLTGGLGMDSWALSKSFEHVTHVEINPLLSGVAQHNFSELQQPNIQCVNASAEQYLADIEAPIDYFFIDPARRVASQKVFRLESTEPNILELKPKMLQKAKGYIIKTSPLLDIAHAIAALETVEQLYVVAVEGECKELLIKCGQLPNENPKIQAIDLRNDGSRSVFEFRFQEEATAQAEFSMPQNYLYEPNAACMKSGGFNMLAQTHHCKKLATNSHLYSSDTLVEAFPGRAFKVIAVTKVDKKAVKAIVPTLKANVATRNFPLSAVDLKKKLGISDGGVIYIFGTTATDGKRMLVICEKV